MNKTEEQQLIVNQLVETFGINGERILFLNPNKPSEPWIPPSELKTIARNFGGFQAMTFRLCQVIEATNQMVVEATITDKNGIVYQNFGVATYGESLPNGETVSPEDLARGRALSAVLDDAGFNPLKSNAVISLEFSGVSTKSFANKAVSRTNDIRRIHALAKEAELIVGDNKTLYKKWLFTSFPEWFESAEKASIEYLDQIGRKQVIDKLVNLLNNYAKAA